MKEISKTNQTVTTHSGVHESDIEQLVKFEEEIGPIQIGKVYFVKSGDPKYHYSSQLTYIKPVRVFSKKTNHNGKEYYYLAVEFKYTTDLKFKGWNEKLEIKSLSDLKSNLKGASITNELDIETTFELAEKLISGELTSEDLNELKEEENNVEGPGTSMMHKGSKESLINVKDGLVQASNKLEMVKNAVNQIMIERTRELERIKDDLQGIMTVYKKQMVKIQKVIDIIELYLGVEEELYQISEGELAPKDTIITFRQLVLYMDEEVGVWEDQGLDYSKVDQFDQWLMKDRNFEKIIPEVKGMVVLHPRRNPKDYGRGGDPWGSRNEANLNHTYYLIRNGDTLHRIYSDKMVIGSLLFPRKNQLNEMLEKLDKETSHFSKEEKKEKLDDVFYTYRKQAILIQGLLDRTTLFHPLPKEKINVFDISDKNSGVTFIHDGEASLPSGRLSFWEWHKKINSTITKGSRVVYSEETGRELRRSWSSSDWLEERLLRKYRSKYSVPTSPQTNFYTVEEGQTVITDIIPLKELDRFKENYKGVVVKKNLANREFDRKKDGTYSYHFSYKDSVKETLEAIHVEGFKSHDVIMYNPKDTVYSWDYNAEPTIRKNRLSFEIFKDDRFIINFDQISLEDVEFYIHSRVDRPNYLTMLPLLKQLKKLKLTEIEMEKDFVQLVLDESARLGLKLSFQDIEEYCEWWKTKNKWKRNIKSDDSKAFRMILSKIKRDHKLS